MISGIVLAAGQSTRMGRSKVGLQVGGETFLERAAHTLRTAGCARVLVVVNASTDASRVSGDVDIVVNPRAESEQIESLRLALARVAADTEAVLVLPVDVPLLEAGTAAAVVQSFQQRHAPIVAPAHEGIAGHPILLARELFDEIERGEWEHGVRSILEAHGAEVRLVDVADAGVLIDIDTPADYERHIGQS